ncbi:Histone acetyltransferase MYST4 [Echinococcus granulosus]|uniref:Histone acetyltransferase MYST4 n=1 Tax=Echinococcus granulosus TaxID=6210 RepID=W6V2F6_ECHGR|nr:Histone acetyltransferase MYST4 [Echinococcus granulosus]EUB60109.1 Histone acetyltransferase MYST4 [Echinococcus granulosus]
MVSATPMPTLSLAPPPPPPASSGGATGAPAAMMMYPGIYNPTVFAVAPDTMVTTTFQPDTSTVSAAAGTVTMPTPAVALTTTVGTTGGVAISTDVVTETSVTSTTPANAGAANSSSTSAPETPKKERVEEATSAETDVCCRCHQKASENGNDKFLVCGDCGLKAHLLSQGRRKLQAPGPSTDGLVGYFHPESSPAEECLWSANFFGHSSVSQLTYTLVYLLGKILCIRSGAELRAMHLWNTLKLFPMHKLPQHNQKVVMEYELHYTLPPDPPIPPPALYENSKRLLSLSERAGGNRFLVILDHILVKTQKGFVIKHSVKNNHQRCLVCLHALLLQKRSCSKRSLRVDNYFLSWMDSSPSARFLTDPLSDVALSTIVYDIRVVLTSLQQYLQRGPVPLETNLWSIFAQGQQFAGSPSQQSRPVLAGHGEECSVPLDLSVRGRAHPKCLDFWPEVTRRARHGVWQCADCKSCSVCKNKEAENVILICEACDKGFHGNCHSPVVPEKSANQTTPWVCSGCQAEGYCVHVGNVSSSAPVSTPSSADLGVSSLAISTSEGVMSTSSMNSKPNQPSTTAMMTTTAGSVDPLLAEPTGVTVPENSNVPIPIKESETKASAKPVSTLTTADLPGPLPMEEGEKNGEEREDAEEDDSMPPNLGTPHHDPPASEMPLLQTDSGRPEDVRLWTVDHVADWLREQGGFEKEAEAFRHQDIDGTSLLLLKSMSLLTAPSGSSGVEECWMTDVNDNDDDPGVSNLTCHAVRAVQPAKNPPQCPYA